MININRRNVTPQKIRVKKVDYKKGNRKNAELKLTLTPKDGRQRTYYYTKA